MPGLNKRGPAGAGPMTGRQMGRCAGNDTGFADRGFRNFGCGYRGGYGRGGGRGQGFGWRNSFGYNHDDFVPDVSDEILLENEARTLKNQLSYVEKELGRIRKGKSEG